MSSPKNIGPASSASSWRDRASELQTASDGARNPHSRETLRRKAAAADNIADAMDHAARQAVRPEASSKP
jgi:hypothetical protein